MDNSVWIIIACAVGAYLVSRLAKRLLHAAQRRTAATLAERLDAQPDRPRNFGYKTAWLAVAGAEPDTVASALQLRDPQPANWETGLAYGMQGRGLFVSPRVADWVFVVGTQLPDLRDSRTETDGRRLLRRLGEELPSVCYFGSHRVTSYYAWARVRAGKLERAYAYLGDRGETLCDQGRQTPEERELAFNFFADEAPTTEGDAYWERTDLRFPDEDDVIAIAERWSLDPTTLESLDLAPGTGLAGGLPDVKA